jgi:hypothetical protein
MPTNPFEPPKEDTDKQQSCRRCGKSLSDAQAAQSFRQVEELASKLIGRQCSIVRRARIAEFVGEALPYCPECFDGLEHLLTTQPRT